MRLFSIIAKITPTVKEKGKVNRLTNKILNKLNKNLVKSYAIAGGSFAKDTWLHENNDIDIFVIFDREFKSEEIGSMLEFVIKKTFMRYEVIHGSRDYFQLKKGKYTFEIIPVLKIGRAEEAKNIMDVSPLHVNFVLGHINKNKKLADEIRLTKAFCIAQKVYGAESYIKGFSGYVLELLTTYYGSFENLVRNALKWRLKEVIDIKHYYDGLALKKLNKSKLYSPLVVIDPVQKERNAAAALSKEKFDRFILACKEYLKNPSEEFFIKKEVMVNKLKKNKNILIFKVKPLKGKKDIIGAKILKAFEHIKGKLNENDFIAEEADWQWDKKVIFWYILKNITVSKYEKHYGPPVSDKKNLEEFKKKWHSYKIFKEKNRVYINLERKFTRATDYANNLIKDETVKENIKKIKRIS